MMKGLRIITAVCALASGILMGCADRVVIDTVEPGTEIMVRLAVSVEPEADFSIRTRGEYVADESVGEDVSIYNLWILQFGGTGADAPLRESRYLESFDPDESVKLIATSSANRIVLIANTFDSNLAFADCETLSKLEEAFRPVAAENDVTRNVGGKRCPLMSAYRDITLTESGGAPIAFSLKRCISKVNVTITNNTIENEAPDVTIDKVTICSVPNKIFFFTSYDLPDRFPAVYSQDRVDYADMLWTDGDGDDKTRRYTFYMPVNKCGSMPAVSNPTEQSRYMPSGATYLRVLGSYTDGSGLKRSVEYHIPIGATLTECNLLPGGKYTCNLTINDPSDRSSDSRAMEDYLVDYCQEEHANSYIINPPRAEDTWKNYRIPVERVFDFWNPGFGYFKEADNALLPGCNGWKVDILWSEFQLTEDVNFKWIKQTGTDYQDYFEFAVNAGIDSGNFVICLRRYTDAGQTELSDVCMWSWQMWVTDYNPNAAFGFVPDVDGSGNEQQFEYPVSGGAVHRYNYTAWKTGRFRNSFIMDRNLGNIAVAPYNKNAKKGHLYYQHGRKDPLTPINSTPAHPVYNVLEGFAASRINNITSTGLTDNVPYTIYHPTVKIGWSINSSLLWQVDWKYSYGCYWGDVRATKANVKSIFDPCPPGWMVPSSDVVNAATNSSIISNIVLSDKVTAIIPGAGLVGGYNNVEEYVAWAGQQKCALYYSNMSGFSKLQAAGCDGNNAIAYPVRCVTENILE